jgi:hypothetical protein
LTDAAKQKQKQKQKKRVETTAKRNKSVDDGPVKTEMAKANDKKLLSNKVRDVIR